MGGIETLVIPDNNPSGLGYIFLIIAVGIIIVNLINAQILKARKKRLEDVREKIIRRHEQLEMEYSKKEAQIHAKRNTDFDTF